MTATGREGLTPEPSGDVPARHNLIRVVDRGPVGFVITSKSGVIEWVNSTLCEWLGFEATDLIGARSFQELLSPGGRIYYDTHVRPLVHMQHAANEIALELVRADGRRIPVLINATLEIDDVTGDETIETFVVDATRRREYETELLRERQTAERSEARLQVMYDIVSAVADAQTIEDIVEVVTERARRSLHGVRCALWLFDPGEHSAARVGPIPEGEPDAHTEIDFPEGGLALDHLAAGRVVVIADHRESSDTYPLICGWMEDAGMRSAAVVPLFDDDRLIGALTYGYADAHTFDEPELRAARALAAHTEQGLSRARVLEAERLNKRHLESLLEFTTVLSAALTLEEVIDAIAERGQELLGGAGSRVALLDGSGASVRFVRSTTSGGQNAIDLPLDRRSIGCEAIRTNRPVVVESREALEDLFPDSPILDHPNVGRVMAMPLRRGGEVLGAWVVVDNESGPSDSVDLTMFGLFAEQAGQATQRAALHEAEALARSQADVRNQVSAALNGAITTSDVARAITVQGRAAFAASAIAVFVVDPDEPKLLRLENQDGLDAADAAAAATVAIDERLEDLLSGPVAPMFVVGTSEFDDLFDVALGTDRRGAAALLPLGVATQALGVIVMGFDHYDALSSATRAALSGLTAEANIGLARARRYDVDHDVATTLQRSLLPSVGDVGPQWSVSTSHEPWSELLEVGGDLFDVTPFDDGRLMLVVGDVVGHGLAAAAAMGMLRSAAKMLALVSSGPAKVIEGLHAFAAVTPGVRYSTVCCIEVRADGSGRYSCAGHPYPVLRQRDGRTEILDGGRSPLLGVGDSAPLNATFVMVPGSSLVAYTDGLIEQRGLSVDAGIDQLRQILSGSGDSSDPLSADDLVRAMLDGREREDDVLAVCLTRVESELG